MRHGRANTAMQSFAGILDDSEIEAVADFVLEALVRCGSFNTRYHTVENGWPDHEVRNGAAFAFVAGALAIDAPEGELSVAQRDGLRLFHQTCSICHEGRAGAARSGPPAAAGNAGGVPPKADDQVRAAQGEYRGHEGHNEYSEYGGGYSYSGDEAQGEHDRPPALASLTTREAAGQDLYRRACAMCHAADGSGKNWIGTFLEPHPPNFTDPATAARFDDRRLTQVILDGLRGTSMPAFRGALDSAQVEAIVAYVKRAFLERAK